MLCTCMHGATCRQARLRSVHLRMYKPQTHVGSSAPLMVGHSSVVLMQRWAWAESLVAGHARTAGWVIRQSREVSTIRVTSTAGPCFIFGHAYKPHSAVRRGSRVDWCRHMGGKSLR